MTSLQDKSVGSEIDPTVAEELLVERLRTSFGKTGALSDLDLFVRFASSNHDHYILENGQPSAVSKQRHSHHIWNKESDSIITAQGTEIVVRSASNSGIRRLAEALVGETVKAAEAERREELLLEEVAANWESLDALYETSSEVLRSGSVSESVNGLISRLAALKAGLQAALFLVNGNEIEVLACTGSHSHHLQFADIGALHQVFQFRRAIVLNKLQSGNDLPGPTACWRSATSLAAAPVTVQSSVVGCVVVWTEKSDLHFDTPFSRLVETLSRNASLLMECDSLTRTVRDNERLAQDIEIASSIQETLLTCDGTPVVPGLELAVFSIPSQRIDGDFYDFSLNQDQSIDVLVGDVMGKGVTAALLGVAAKSQFTRVLAAPRADNKALLEPAEIVSAVSGSLNTRLIQLERFITLCYARIDLSTRELKFVDCGHTSSIVHRKQTGETLWLRGDDLPLGVQPSPQFGQHTFRFQPGDTFLLYSDGVTENRNAEGEFYGEERLVDFVETWSSLGPDALINRLRREAKEYCGRETFSDDFTCIAARISLNENEPLQVLRAEFPCQFEELERSREWLTEAATVVPQGIGEDGLIRLQLACGEAVDNCIIHGSKEFEAATVELECLIFPSSITVNIRHKGPLFDPFAVKSPSFDGTRDNGFGMYIISRSADELSYGREPDGTNVISISVAKKQLEG